MPGGPPAHPDRPERSVTSCDTFTFDPLFVADDSLKAGLCEACAGRDRGRGQRGRKWMASGVQNGTGIAEEQGGVRGGGYGGGGGAFTRAHEKAVSSL